jgi:hypothetical protein
LQLVLSEEHTGFQERLSDTRLWELLLHRQHFGSLMGCSIQV